MNSFTHINTQTQSFIVTSEPNKEFLQTINDRNCRIIIEFPYLAISLEDLQKTYPYKGTDIVEHEFYFKVILRLYLNSDPKLESMEFFIFYIKNWGSLNIPLDTTQFISFLFDVFETQFEFEKKDFFLRNPTITDSPTEKCESYPIGVIGSPYKNIVFISLYEAYIRVHLHVKPSNKFVLIDVISDIINQMNINLVLPMKTKIQFCNKIIEQLQRIDDF